MLFFGGYSSILPYLLYLSIVWMCIIIGVKGEIWKFVKGDTTSEQVIISDSDDNKDDCAFVISLHERDNPGPEKNNQDLNTNPDKYAFRNKDIPLPGFKIKPIRQQFVDLNSLSHRGPPENTNL